MQAVHTGGEGLWKLTGGEGWCTDKVHCKHIASSGAKEPTMYQTGTCLAYSKYTRQIQPPYPSLGYCQDIQDMPGHVTTMFQISNCQGYFEYSNTKWPKCAWVVCFEYSLQYSRPCDHHVPNWDILSSFGMCKPSSTSISLIALFKIYLQCFHNIPAWEIENTWLVHCDVLRKYWILTLYLQCTNHVFSISQAGILWKHCKYILNKAIRKMLVKLG